MSTRRRVKPPEALSRERVSAFVKFFNKVGRRGTGQRSNGLRDWSPEEVVQVFGLVLRGRDTHDVLAFARTYRKTATAEMTIEEVREGLDLLRVHGVLAS